jgi:hypothetical protein
MYLPLGIHIFIRSRSETAEVKFARSLGRGKLPRFFTASHGGEVPSPRPAQNLESPGPCLRWEVFLLYLRNRTLFVVF